MNENKTSTDKLIFFYKKINERKEISAHIFNDVFSEFEEIFYKNGKYKSTMANFKKWMKIAAENKGHNIIILNVNKKENIIQGIKNVWSIHYNQN